MSLNAPIDNNQTFFWIAAASLAQQEQGRDDILQAMAQPLSSVQKHHIDNVEQWPALIAQLAQPSLWASEAATHVIHLNVQGFNSTHQTHLKALAQKPEDVRVILITRAIDKKTQQTKWFKTLSQRCQFFSCFPPKGRQYEQWLIQYVQKHNNTLSVDLAQQMAQCYEGHLDAAKQLLDQCLTRFPSTPLTAARCQPYLEDAQRWEGFALSDALLAGQQQRAHAIFSRLKQQEDALLLMLWFVRQPLEWVLSPKQAPYFKQSHLSQAQQRWSKRMIYTALMILADIETQFKTHQLTDVWQPLEQLILKLTLSEKKHYTKT